MTSAIITPADVSRADRAAANLPVDRRGGGTLDHQIDRWKREKRSQDRRDAKTAAAERRENKRLAKLALSQHLEAIVARHGPKLGARAVRDMLTRWAKWEPVRLLKFVDRYLDETDDRSRTKP